MRRRERERLPLPEGRADRLVLALGAAALIALIPMLWMWLLYGGALTGTAIYGAAIGLGALTAGIGAAMIRSLDHGR